MRELRNLPADDIVQAVMKALDASAATRGQRWHKRHADRLLIDGVYREGDFVVALVAELETRLGRLDVTPAVQ